MSVPQRFSSTAKPITTPRTVTTPKPVTPPPPTVTSPAPAHGPDLAAEAAPGELRVVNVGDRPAGPFRVTFEEKTVLRSEGLGPGERSDPLKVPQGRPCPVPPAIIDPDDAVHESDEANNEVEVPCVPPPATTSTDPPPIK